MLLDGLLSLMHLLLCPKYDDTVSLFAGGLCQPKTVNGKPRRHQQSYG